MITTIEKPMYKTIMLEKTITWYVTEDGKEWKTQDDAEKWLVFVADRTRLQEWPQDDQYEGTWYAVQSLEEFENLWALVKLVTYERCLDPPPKVFPCLVRWSYGGDYPSALVTMTLEEVQGLFDLITGKEG